MKRFCLTWLLISITIFVSAQTNVDAIINSKEAERIEKILASDEMQGRRAGTPAIDKAASFIADEFQKAGLQPFTGKSFLQAFHKTKTKVISVKAEIDEQELNPVRVIVHSTSTQTKVDEKSGLEIVHIKSGKTMREQMPQVMESDKSMIVFVDSSFARNFPRLADFAPEGFSTDPQNSRVVIYILGSYQPTKFRIKAESVVQSTPYANLVGVLPGKSKPSEYVIFSAHYDHLGIAKKPVNGDSIYNGANDDAAGTTAVILLAKYFKALGNNERTIIFAAFTAEELGGYGSQYFSKQLDPGKVVAMFNIEMIGTESKWGKNSAYITGFDKTSMGEILQKNLAGSGFTFYPDPYPQQNLFYRSDNATLARLGVPAHTISTAKMDEEPHYHKLTDEVSTLDLQNMTIIIRSIALSATTIVAGKDTPTRVKVEELK
ncbi:MAG: aminopeptidase [Chitinophagaceae bacterium]